AFANPGSPLSGTVTLNATSDPDAAKVAFQQRGTGGGTWTTIAEDNGPPWSIAFDTTGVADGVYDLRAVSYDSSGTPLQSAAHEDIRIDNVRPYVASSTPADGSVVDSASSIVLTANEALSSVEHVKLDGSAVTPDVSAKTVTVASGDLATGPHVLDGA